MANQKLERVGHEKIKIEEDYTYFVNSLDGYVWRKPSKEGAVGIHDNETKVGTEKIKLEDGYLYSVSKAGYVSRRKIEKAPKAQAPKLPFHYKALAGILAIIVAFTNLYVLIESNPGLKTAYASSTTGTSPIAIGVLFIAFIWYSLFKSYFNSYRNKEMSGAEIAAIVFMVLLGGFIAIILYYLFVWIASKLKGTTIKGLGGNLKIGLAVVAIIIVFVGGFMLGYIGGGGNVVLVSSGTTESIPVQYQYIVNFTANYNSTLTGQYTATSGIDAYIMTKSQYLNFASSYPALASSVNPLWESSGGSGGFSIGLVPQNYTILFINNGYGSGSFTVTRNFTLSN